jgi:hypothetical protein
MAWLCMTVRCATLRYIASDYILSIAIFHNDSNTSTRSGAFHYAASLCITLHDAPSHDMPWHCIDKILHAPVVRSIAFERIARCSVVNHRDFECTAQLSMAVWRIAFHEGKIWPDTASYYIYIYTDCYHVLHVHIYIQYIYIWLKYRSTVQSIPSKSVPCIWIEFHWSSQYDSAWHYTQGHVQCK